MDLTQHILYRNVDLTVHTVWIDDINDVATFPLWNLSGQLIGTQQYRRFSDKVQKNSVKGKYYTSRPKMNPIGNGRKATKTVAVWGLESWDFSNTLFVVEGIFDAATLTSRGVSAVALLSNDPSISVQNWLMLVRTMRPVVAVCDPGKAGAKLAKAGHVSVTVDVGNDADLNDAPNEYVTDLIEEYIT